MDGFHRRSLHFQWINCTAIFIESEVEVRPGGQTAAAYIPNDITLLDVDPLFDSLPESTKVHVSGGIDTVMLDFHIITTTAFLIPYLGYETISNRMYGSTRGSSIIYPMMGSSDF